MSRIKITVLVALAALFAFFLAWDARLSAKGRTTQVVPYASVIKTDEEENEFSEVPAEFWLENVPTTPVSVTLTLSAWMPSG